MERSATIFTVSAILVVTAIILTVLFVFADSRASIFGTVTQTGLATDSVTLNKRMGVITTVTQNIISGGNVEFTLNNTQVKLNSVVVVSAEYSGTGVPVLTVSDVAEGSFKIKITNTSLVALTSPVNIHFRIL